MAALDPGHLLSVDGRLDPDFPTRSMMMIPRWQRRYGVFGTHAHRLLSGRDGRQDPSRHRRPRRHYAAFFSVWPAPRLACDRQRPAVLVGDKNRRQDLAETGAWHRRLTLRDSGLLTLFNVGDLLPA
jgi:hypothetical protein